MTDNQDRMAQALRTARPFVLHFGDSAGHVAIQQIDAALAEYESTHASAQPAQPASVWEPVAVVDLERLVAGYPTTAYPPTHPDADRMDKLYTHPQPPSAMAQESGE